MSNTGPTADARSAAYDVPSVAAELGRADGNAWSFRLGPMTVLNRVQCARDGGAAFFERVDEGAITIDDLSDYMAAFFNSITDER